MYPIAEFRTAARRAIGRRTGALMAALATAFLGGITFLYIESRPLDRDDLEVFGYLGATAVGGVVTLTLGVLWRQARHPSLRCPHCRRGLTDSVSQVLASGCCHQCGRQVLERSDELPDDALIPRAELLTADARHQRRTGPLMLVAVTATVGGCVAGANVMDRLDLPDPLGRILFMLLLLTAPISMVLMLRWMAAGAKRDPSLACPDCVQPLTGAGMLVAGTGHCFHCGGRAVQPRVNPLPPPHAGGWWTVERLNEADGQRRRITRRALALVGAVCAVALWVLFLGDRLWGEWRLIGLGLNRTAAGWVADRVPLVIALATMAAGVGVSRSAHRQAKRKYPLDCPRCRQELLPGFARATKCCNHCGWQVVSAPANGLRK